MKLSKRAEKAVRQSIKHWQEDILEPLKAEKYNGVSHYAADCSLCKLYYENACQNCPLYKTWDFCGDGGSAYQVFFHNRTIENAEAMIAALESLLEEE